MVLDLLSTETGFPVTSLVSTATGFPVTSIISAPFCVCTWFITNLLIPSERNEALPSRLPASFLHVPGWPVPTACDHSQGVAPPTGSRMQQVLTLLDVPVYGHGLSRHTQRVSRPAGREGERRAVR